MLDLANFVWQQSCKVTKLTVRSYPIAVEDNDLITVPKRQTTILSEYLVLLADGTLYKKSDME